MVNQSKNSKPHFDADKFAAAWKRDNGLSASYDFGTTDDIRAGRCDEIDLAFWADYIDALEDAKTGRA